MVQPLEKSPLYSSGPLKPKHCHMSSCTAKIFAIFAPETFFHDGRLLGKGGSRRNWPPCGLIKVRNKQNNKTC